MTNGRTKLTTSLPGPAALLRESYAIYKKRAWTYSLVIFAVYIFYISQIPGKPWNWILNLLFFLLSYFGTLVNVNLIRIPVAKDDIKPALTASLKQFLPMLWMYLLSTLAVLGGVFLFVIPGLYLSYMYSLSLYVLVFENERGLAAVLKSYAYIQGMFWAVFGRMLLAGLVTVSLSAFFVFMLPSFDKAGQPVIGRLLLAVLSAVIYPVVTTYHYAIYNHLKKLNPDPLLPSKTPTLLLIIWSIVAPVLLLGFLLLLVFLGVFFSDLKSA